MNEGAIHRNNLRYIKQIILKVEKDCYIAKLLFYDEMLKGSIRQLGQAEENHSLISDLKFETNNNQLTIKIGWKGLKDLNPYLVLQKMIEKIEATCYLLESEFFFSPLIIKIYPSFVTLNCLIQVFPHDQSNLLEFKISNILYCNLYDEVRRNQKEEQMYSQFRICMQKVQIVEDKKIKNNEYMLTQAFVFQEFQISWLESISIIPYLLIVQLVDFSSDLQLSGQNDQIKDIQYFQEYIKFAPQAHSIGITFLRFLMPSPIETPEKSLKLIEDIYKYPFQMWKLMPFTLIVEQQECTQCMELNKQFQFQWRQLKYTSNTTREMRQQLLREVFMNPSVKQIEHIKTVNIKITLQQFLMLSGFNFQENKLVLEYIEKFKIQVDEIFSYYFQLLEAEAFTNKKTSPLLKQGYWSFSYSSYEQLEFIIKCIKSFGGQLQKFFRLGYYFNLIGKDSKIDPSQLTVDTFKITLGCDSQNLSDGNIFCQLKDSSLTSFFLVLKYIQTKNNQAVISGFNGQQARAPSASTPANPSGDLFIIYNTILPKGELDPRSIPQRKQLYFMMLKSVNYSQFEKLSLQYQISHLNNFYGLIENYLSTKVYDPLIYLSTIFFSKDDIGVCFSKKDKEITINQISSNTCNNNQPVLTSIQGIVIFEIFLYSNSQKEQVQWKMIVTRLMPSKKIHFQEDKNIPDKKEQQIADIKFLIQKQLEIRPHP